MVENLWIKFAEIFLNRNTNFWLITTILLIVYIGYSKAKNIFCNYRNRENCNYHEQKKCERLLQKEFTYLGIIVTIVSVFLISLSLYTDDEVMGLFSFTSTITSIILSVIAIILTITSEVKNATTKEKLEESAKQIESTTELLTSATQNLQLEILEDIGEKINSLHGIMNQAIIKIDSAEENSKATREVMQQVMHYEVLNGNPDIKEIKIYSDPKKIENLQNKYVRKDENDNDNA